MSNIVSKDILRKYAIEWAQRQLSVDFKFREYQLDYIVDILYSILNDNIKMNVVEAPTGSGKSIMAMVICGVAYDYFKKTSYILVSDIGLLEQYVCDFNKYGLSWGHLKGSDNYFCYMNNMPFNSGDCKINKVSYKVLFDNNEAENRGYSCALSCEYIQNRKKCMSSPVSLMTYHLYLCMLNDVKPLYGEEDGLPPFDIRDIVIADECHKIPEIVQSFCSPAFNSKSTSINFNKLLTYGIENDIIDEPVPSESKESKEKDKDDKSNNVTLAENEDEFVSEEERLRKIPDNDLFYNYKRVSQSLQKRIFNVDSNDESLKSLQYFFELERRLLNGYGNKLQKSFIQKNDMSMIHIYNEVFNHNRLICEFIKVIKQLGTKAMVRNGNDCNNYTLNCIFEDYMVNKFFNEQCKNMVLMSATIGDSKIFRHMIGGDFLADKENGYRFNRIPSTFNYDKSPIYIMPSIRMSYSLKEKNMHQQLNIINQICSAHSNQKGLIHTGNYEFTQKLIYFASDDLKQRLLAYTNSKDKNSCIDEFLDSKNKVLAGPSLIEGINLPNDNCRFMILMKCPYANLADKLVKAKMTMIDGWYQADAMKKFIQSLGRGVRNKEDWCITYILDGCFVDLITKTGQNLNPELVHRFKYIY